MTTHLRTTMLASPYHPPLVKDMFRGLLSGIFCLLRFFLVFTGQGVSMNEKVYDWCWSDAEGQRFDVWLRVHERPVTCDQDSVLHPGHDGASLDPGDPWLATQRATLRLSSGTQQVRDSSQTRRRASQGTCAPQHPQLMGTQCFQGTEGVAGGHSGTYNATIYCANIIPINISPSLHWISRKRRWNE